MTKKKAVLKYTLLNKKALVPERGTKESSGLDLFSPKDYYIESHTDIIIPTGVAFDIPVGYDLSVYNKSGVATKKKLIKGAELIDVDYTGDIHINLFNLGAGPQKIKRGDKIAQVVLRPVVIPILEQIEKIEKITERGSGKYGSTGETKEK